MAQTKVTIKNGQSVTGGGATVETQIIPDDTKAVFVYFQVTTGTLQVTVAREGQENVVAAEIFAFATTSGINRMRIEQANGAEGERKVIYIQGTGVAYFTW